MNAPNTALKYMCKYMWTDPLQRGELPARSSLYES
jgi:hypothetical protein